MVFISREYVRQYLLFDECMSGWKLLYGKITTATDACKDFVQVKLDGACLFSDIAYSNNYTNMCSN